MAYKPLLNQVHRRAKQLGDIHEKILQPPVVVRVRFKNSVDTSPSFECFSRLKRSSSMIKGGKDTYIRPLQK